MMMKKGLSSKWEPNEGGGSRKVNISKDAQKTDLIQEATGLSFPNGRNSLRPLTDFELDLRNYEEVTVDDVITVGKLYTDTKFPLLRFYLTTNEKINHSPHSHSAGFASTFERQHRSQNQSTVGEHWLNNCFWMSEGERSACENCACHVCM